MSDELEMKEESIEIARINFSFAITRDEANAVMNKPKGSIARKLRKYMISILKAGCKKMLETDPEENVNNCEVNIES